MVSTENTQAPLFLRKTYRMIDTCDSRIAGWSEDGDVIIVKDADKLASTIIPQFFKHNKFSSLVRQLNFYGFRKVKLDEDCLTLAAGEEENSTGTYRCFKHDKFRRGQPEMLKEVRKANNPHPEFSSIDQNEVNALKGEIETLQSTLKKLTNEFRSAANAVTAQLEIDNKRSRTDFGCSAIKRAKPTRVVSPRPFLSQAEHYMADEVISSNGEGIELDNDILDSMFGNSSPGDGIFLNEPLLDFNFRADAAIDGVDLLMDLDAAPTSSFQQSACNKLQDSLSGLSSDDQLMVTEQILNVVQGHKHDISDRHQQQKQEEKYSRDNNTVPMMQQVTSLHSAQFSPLASLRVATVPHLE